VIRKINWKKAAETIELYFEDLLLLSSGACFTAASRGCGNRPKYRKIPLNDIV